MYIGGKKLNSWIHESDGRPRTMSKTMSKVMNKTSRKAESKAENKVMQQVMKEANNKNVYNICQELLQKFFQTNFQCIPFQNLVYTRQICQVTYYMGLDETTFQIFSIVWHSRLQKPMILFNNMMFVINIHVNHNFGNLLHASGFGTAVLKCNEGQYENDVLLKTGVCDLQPFPLMLFYNMPICMWWYNTWMKQYDDEIASVEDELQLIDPKTMADNSTQQCSTNDDTPTYVSHVEDVYKPYEITEADDHIAYHVAMYVLN